MTDHRPASVPPPPTTQLPTYELWQPAPPTRRRRRVPRWILAVAVATAVASVVSFTTVLLWPRSDQHVAAGPLQFQGFALVNRVVFDEPTRTSLTAVHGSQGYAAWEQGGDLSVISFDVTTGVERWRAQLTGAAQWHRLVATPEMLLVLEYESDSAEPRQMFGLAAETGAQQWQTELRGEDRLVFTEGTLGVLDRRSEVLRGLDWASGTTRWTLEFEGAAQAFGVANPAGLAQPADPGGNALSPLTNTDRIILITADRRLRVIDGRDGGVISERANVADPSEDLFLAYQDRLFIASDQTGYRVESYNLDNVSTPPSITFTSAGSERRPEQLVACGEGRICLLDTVPFDDETLEALAIDIESGGELWRQPVAGGEQMFPVGDWLVVNGEAGFREPLVMVIDADGQERVNQRGVGVRLNDSNLVLFGASLEDSESEIRAVGMTTEHGVPVELGRLPAVDPAGCTWNDRYVLCAGRDGAEVWQFAATD